MRQFAGLLCNAPLELPPRGATPPLAARRCDYLSGQRDLDVTIHDSDGECHDRTGRGRVEHSTSAQVKARPMQEAFDLAMVDITLGEGYFGVGAFVVNGEDLVASAHKTHNDAI